MIAPVYSSKPYSTSLVRAQNNMSQPPSGKPVAAQPRFGFTEGFSVFNDLVEGLVSAAMIVGGGVVALGVGAAIKAAFDRKKEAKINPEMGATAAQLKSLLNQGRVQVIEVQSSGPQKQQARIKLGEQEYDVSITNHASSKFNFQPSFEAVRCDNKVVFGFEVDRERMHGKLTFPGGKTFYYLNNPDGPVGDKTSQKSSRDKAITEDVLDFAKGLSDLIAKHGVDNNASDKPKNPFAGNNALEI